MSDLATNSHFVLAYSGCDEDVGESALSSGSPNGLVASNNGYDWLGTGIYFWESDPARALQWAVEAVQRHAKRYKEKGTPIRVRRPFVVGAVIRMGTTLDLTTMNGIELVREGHNAWAADMLKAGTCEAELPKNTADDDMKGRFLDFQVVNYTCQEYAKTKKRPIDTVRAIFPEGKAAYVGAGFRERTHTQICVREPDRAVMGYFRVRPG